LFAVAQGYGILVYNIRTGFSEAHIRFGPSRAAVRRMARLDNRLWFVGGQTAVALDSAGNWDYFLTRPGDLSTGGFRLLFGNVTNLERNEGLSALLADSAGLLLGTDYGIYSLGSNNKLTQLLNLPRRVNGLLRLHDSLMFGTEQGLFLSRGDSVVEYSDPYGATDWGVFDIARTTDGTAYFAALGGIVSRTADGRWFRYVPPGFDLKQPVRALATAGTRVFMVTGPTVTVLDTKDDSYTTIDATRGLPVSEVNSLYADDRHLWIASDRLIARLDYTKELR
jgi:ligand-binding sensor domain-containing protein